MNNRLLRTKELSWLELEVLESMLKRKRIENYIIIYRDEIDEIADELGVSRTYVPLAIDGLSDKKIIAEGPKLGTSYFTYRLSPKYSKYRRSAKVINFSEERKRFSKTA